MNEIIYKKYFDIFQSQIGINTNYKRIERKNEWVTIRLFISSTFKDQLVERHILKTLVIPELELWARERCIEIVAIDMTWGILENSTAENTVNICLSEIDRCQQTNGAPFFLFHGGQRYGWAPSLNDIGETLSNKYQIIDGASVTAMEVLHGALRSNNPNAIFCLRDSSFLKSVPSHLINDYCEEKGSIAEACQQALIDSIKLNNQGIIYYNPKSKNLYDENVLENSFGLDWSDFADNVTKCLKSLIEEQYPIDINTELTAGSFEIMKKQQSLYIDSLLQHIVPRSKLVSKIKNVIYHCFDENNINNNRLITIVSPSGRGKSSLVAELVQSLNTDIIEKVHEDINVICHFIGPSENSDDLGTTCRRITNELLKCWGRQQESKTPDDLSELCSLLRTTMSLGPINSSNNTKIILVVDALNQLNEIDPIKKLAWLPSPEDMKMLSENLVIVTSTIPGPEYDYLETLHSNSDTIFEVNPLDNNEKYDITVSLLLRAGKSFSDDQMKNFLENPGSASPLWIQVAFSYLRQHARFETLMMLIKSTPSNIEELINLLLSITEKETNYYLVKSLLLGCVLARQGLKESEALILVPEIATVISNIEENNSDDNKQFNFDTNDWAHLRASLDVFLLHFMLGAPVILAPSHSVVRDAICKRYANDDRIVKAVRYKIGEFFERRNLGIIDISRTFTEGTWAYLKLEDRDALTRILVNLEVINYCWYNSGNRGHQWDLLSLWSFIDMNDDGNEDSLPSVNALLGLALKLCDQLVSNDNKINDELYLLIKAIFELLKMQRREHNAIRFLQKVELLLKDLDLSYHHDDDIDLKKRVILSWTQVSISDCYYAQGRYDEALNSFEKCIEDFKSIETLAPDPIIADCYLQIGRIHDAEKRLDQSLLAFEMAREIFSAYTNRQGTPCLPIIRKLLSSLGESKSYSVDGDIHEADTLKEIANVYFSMDDFDTAEIYYLKSLNICKAVNGNAHPKTARARWGLGICERGQGKIEKSITTHLEVADIFKKCLGSSHPDTADMEYNIAFLLNDKGDYESALVHFYSALSVYIKTYGHRHRHCGWTYHDIGETLMKANKVNAAIDAFSTAFSIRSEALGLDNSETIETKNSLDKALALALEQLK